METFEPSAHSVKATGSAASCGMEKAVISISPRVNRWEGRRVSMPGIFSTSARDTSRAYSANVPSVMYTGACQERLRLASPEMWSECSWDTRMPCTRSIDPEASGPSAASRRRVSRRLKPASTSTRVVEVSTSVALPELPEPRINTRSEIAAPTGDLAMMAKRPPRVNPPKGRDLEDGDAKVGRLVLPSSAPCILGCRTYPQRSGVMLPGNGIIVKDPDILGGAPVFRGTRVPFQALLDYLEGGQTMDEFLDDFPTVTREAAIAALELAKSLVVGQLG